MSGPTQTTQSEGRATTTYTQWSLFRNCRRACFWRFEEQLVPRGRDERPLGFGRLIHECLEKWHGGEGMEAVETYIDSYYNPSSHPSNMQDWHYANALMRAYAKTYPDEPFEVVALEKGFTGEITNPATGHSSRSFILSGKVDGVVKKPDGSFWLLEHKTASTINGDYVSKLWTDLQIALYSHYLREALSIPIEGVIYNILNKPKLRQRVGETEEEYQERLTVLAAKNKSGRSNAKRLMPETDEEFAARLDDWFAEKDRFLRVELILDLASYRSLRSELWELTQQYLHARREGAWYQNTDFCFRWNRPCPYYAICSAKDNPLVIANDYERKAPHQELAETERSTPTF